MKQFQEMIKTVQLTKKIRYLDSTSLNANLVSIDRFFETAEKAEVFVFSPKNLIPETIQLHHENGNVIYKDFDAPFPIFSIEVLGQNIMVPMEDASNSLTVHSLLVWEVSPKRFGTYVFATLDGRQFVFSSGAFDAVVAAFVERLNSENVGVEKCRERIPIGSGQTKRVHTVRKITHIRPASVSTSPISNRSIDWSQRWFVRGHWRKIEGLGKDREGVYQMEGYTWVSEYLKGPDDAPLIRKTRVVHSSL